jgi:uncharacterized protein (DUF58 family)
MDNKQNARSQPAGILLSKFGLILAAILLMLAAWAGQTVIVVILGLVLVTATSTKLWSFYSLKGVHCERYLTGSRAFPGEELELKIRVINHKLLPLPWLQVCDEVPAGFTFERTPEPGTRPGFEMISRFTSIMWYSSVSWKYHLHCEKRGYYPLGPLTITSGDIFGFYPRTSIESVEDYIIVYPEIYSIADIAIPSLYPLGEAKSNKRLFEDPSHMIAIRDYNPGDSLRRIHWKASARHQSLQVKVFQPTTSLKVALFLAIDSFQVNGIWNHDEEESGISTAASLASYLIEKKCQVGLWSNAQLTDSGQSARIPLRGGVDQLIQILEALAKVVSVVTGPFINFIQTERQNLPLGTTLVFIFHRIPEGLKEAVIDLRESGYQVQVFQIGETEKESLPPDVDYFHVRPSGNIVKINLQSDLC